jgi:hypothetical protein
MMPPTVLKHGERFGKLTVIKRHFTSLDSHHIYYECLCDCGTYHTVMACNLTNGSTHSCGCWNAESKRIRGILRREQKGDVKDEVKRCSHCKVLKPINEYVKDKKRADGLYHRCRNCQWKVIRASKYKFADYDAMLREQLNLYCICNRQEMVHKSLSVDHDHKTGKVRALLCTNCNVGLGRFNDDPKLLEKAAQYLRTFARLA